MKDGLLRRIVKRLARLRFEIDLRATRGIQRLQGQHRYELGGSCERCARCCEAPSIQVGPLIYRLKSLRWLFLSWHRVVNGFDFRKAEREGYVFVFECQHFDPESRRCDSYESRPGMCRDYPRGLLSQTSPEFFPECGYRPVLPGAADFRDALVQVDLPPEQREALFRKLNIAGDQGAHEELDRP